MTDQSNEISIEFSPETMRALETAAAEHGLSVSDFAQEALRRFLAATSLPDGVLYTSASEQFLPEPSTSVSWRIGGSTTCECGSDRPLLQSEQTVRLVYRQLLTLLC